MAAVRRAWMLEGDLARVAAAALREGEAALARFGLELFRPLKPMLAQPAEDVDEALGHLERAALEWLGQRFAIQTALHGAGGAAARAH